MSKDGTFNYHPIQLMEIEVLQLNFELGKRDEHPSDDDKSHFRFMHAHSEYSEESNTFAVKVKAVVNNSQGSEEDAPFTITVEVVGLFQVDEESFPVGSIAAFAEQNGPLILYPYLREQVFGIASRAGVPQPILPLFEVPPFKLERE